MYIYNHYIYLQSDKTNKSIKMKNQDQEIDAIYRVANVEPNIIMDDIKANYQRLNHKTVFIRLLAASLSKSPVYLRNQWFSGFWSIPISEQPKVLEFLNNVLKNQ